MGDAIPPADGGALYSYVEFEVMPVFALWVGDLPELNDWRDAVLES